MKNFEDLKQQYLKILLTLDELFLNKTIHTSNLSGLFVTSEPENYWQSKNKIMIIGAETRGWNVKIEEDYHLEHYLDATIAKHKKFFNKMMEEPSSNKITFHDFTRAVAYKVGKEGLLYCNLFCFAWKEKSPMQSKYFDEIKRVSFELLKAQLDYFEPEIIIFANGSQNTIYRREVFDPSFYKDGKNYIEEGISKSQLYKFSYGDKYTCYKIQHPSTIRGRTDAKKARIKLIDLLPEK